MIYAAIGRRERGKTTLVYSLAHKMPARVIFDPRGLIDTGAAVRLTEPADLEIAFEALERIDTPEILITPGGDAQTMFEETNRYVARWIRELPERQLAYVVDEIRFVDLDDAAFQWILRCAPRDTVHVFLTCHRPVEPDFPTDIRAILDQWLIFHTVQRSDLKEIRDRCGEQVARRVQSLKAYEWIQWDDGLGEAFEHRDPAAWYVSLKPRQHDRGAVLIAPGQSLDPVDKKRLFDL